MVHSNTEVEMTLAMTAFPVSPNRHIGVVGTAAAVSVTLKKPAPVTVTLVEPDDLPATGNTLVIARPV